MEIGSVTLRFSVRVFAGLLACAMAGCGGSGGTIPSHPDGAAVRGVPSQFQPPSNTVIAGDTGYVNGQVSVVDLGSQSVSLTGQSAFEDLDSVAYVPSANAGILGNGATQNLTPFALSGTSVLLGNPLSFSDSAQCASEDPPVTCDATAVVMPNARTVVAALNATGSNYLLEISNPGGAAPAFTQIPVSLGTPEDTAGLVMSRDGKILVSRGGHMNVFEGSTPKTYHQVSQIAQPDGPDHLALRGREGMAIYRAGGDYELLAAGTSTNPQNGTLSMWINLQRGNNVRKTSTRIDPSQHGYAVATDGTTAFVGTDAGIALVPGVNVQKFSKDTTSVVSPLSCLPGSSGLVQISSLALTPDGQWLVVMGMPGPASSPGGPNGCLDVLPVTYGQDGVSLGAAIESVQVAVPYDDQMVVF